MHLSSTRSLARLFLASVTWIGIACGSGEESQPGAAGGGRDGGTDGTAVEAAAGAGGSLLAEGGAGASSDWCDGLDNDGDGALDEGCTCTSGVTQQCYPGPAIPEGCRQGQQTCEAGSWGASKCVGATLPATGETACCSVLGAAPKHPLLDSYLAAYPSASLPKTPDQIKSFDPVADGHKMTWSLVNAGNELVDPTAGGVTVANLEQGRKMARAKAEKSLPAGYTVVDVKEPAVTIEVLGGSGNCNGVGYAWGSALFQTSDEAVSEFVYLYIGLCAKGNDAEGFYYSEQPVQLCKPPQVVK